VAVVDSTWSPSSWRDFEALQQPEWPDPERLAAARERLRTVPPLVFAGEARQVQAGLAEVAAGRAFLLQAGDCAESFHDFERVTDTGYETVTGSTPAVISVVEKINDPRYPSFKGIMAAKSKPIETKSLSDIGLDAGEVGLANAWSAVESFENAPPRAAGETVKDEGNGGGAIADYLASKKLI